MIKVVLLSCLLAFVVMCHAQELPAKALHSKYRVQIAAFSKNNRQAAIYQANKAVQLYGINSYLVLDNQLYKVHIGDFFTKDNALSFLPDVQQNFADAWVAEAQNTSIVQTILSDKKPVNKKPLEKKTNIKSEEKIKTFTPEKLPTSWKPKIHTAAI